MIHDFLHNMRSTISNNQSQYFCFSCVYFQPACQLCTYIPFVHPELRILLFFFLIGRNRSKYENMNKIRSVHYIAKWTLNTCYVNISYININIQNEQIVCRFVGILSMRYEYFCLIWILIWAAKDVSVNVYSFNAMNWYELIHCILDDSMCSCSILPLFAGIHKNFAGTDRSINQSTWVPLLSYSIDFPCIWIFSSLDSLCGFTLYNSLLHCSFDENDQSTASII